MQAREWTQRLPWSIVGLTMLLIGFGFAGISRVETLSESGGHSLVRQALWAVLALGLMVAASMPNYRMLCRWSFAAGIVAVGLLVAVYFFPPINGARRWIRLGPIGLQPSEFAKVAFILCLARWLMFRDHVCRLQSLLVPLLLGLVPLLLVLKEPDLGTSLVFPPVLFAMLLAAGARFRDLAKVALVAVLLLPLLWSQMSREQRSRITAMWEPTTPGVRPSEDAYHLYQSKQMLALGGAWGSVLSGNAVDDPSAYQLPAAKTDFIFSVLGERLGWLGTGGVLLLYIVLAWRGLAVASATREPFGRLTAVGIVALIAVQVVINTAMTVGLAPVTGLSLPLVSYGGSSLVSNCLALGLLLNIGLRPGFEVTNEPFRFREA